MKDLQTKPKGNKLIKPKPTTTILNSLKLRAIAAELLGVTIKVFVICMVVTSSSNNNLHLRDIALAHFFIITALAHCIGRISGCHLNPAITLPFMLYHQISILNGCLYIAAQFTGGILGALIARFLSSADWLDLSLATAQMGNNTVSPSFTVFQGLLGEFVMTSILAFTVWSVAVHKGPEQKWAPVSIASVVTTSVLILGPITGNSLNPARSFGPALVTGRFFSDHWVFWVGPMLGGLFGK